VCSTGRGSSTGCGGSTGCGDSIGRGCSIERGGSTTSPQDGGAGRSRTRSVHGWSTTGTSGGRLANRCRNPVSQPGRRTGSRGAGAVPNTRPRGASGPGRPSCRGNSERVPATSGRPNVSLTRMGGRGRTVTVSGTTIGAGWGAGRSRRWNGQRMILPPQPKSTEIRRPRTEVTRNHSTRTT
jgi:hypothetical protein